MSSSVYIAEVIWFEDNPVDGRTRISVCTTLEDALTSLREHDIHGGADLTATEVLSGSALGAPGAQTWAVHEPGDEPSDEGHLWITRENVRPPGAHRTLLKDLEAATARHANDHIGAPEATAALTPLGTLTPPQQADDRRER